MLCTMKFKTFNYYKNLLEFSKVTTGRQKCRHDNTISPYCLCYQKIRRKEREQQKDRENYNLIWDVTLIFFFARMEEEFRGGGRGLSLLYCRQERPKNTAGNQICDSIQIANIVSYMQGSAKIGFILDINALVINLSHKVCEFHT